MKPLDRDDDRLHFRGTRRLIALAWLALLPLYGAAEGASVRGGPPPEASAYSWLQEAERGVVIDLRTSRETDGEEAARAASHGADYVRIPMGRTPATLDQVEQVANLLASNERVYLHCRSGERAGEMLARVRLAQGASETQALEDARGIGLDARLPLVLEILEQAENGAMSAP